MVSNIEANLKEAAMAICLKHYILQKKESFTDLDGSIFKVTQDMTDEQKLDFSKWEKDFCKEIYRQENINRIRHLEIKNMFLMIWQMSLI